MIEPGNFYAKNRLLSAGGYGPFNAMKEDAATHTWWRQANGEAVAGSLKGTQLSTIQSQQTTLAQWLALQSTNLLQLSIRMH